MQATKQQLSPTTKKCPPNDKSECPPSPIKSVAQRVMEVTSEDASVGIEQERIKSLDNQQWNRQASTSNLVSDPPSPKAESAPATPCNITPTAFHQHTSHLHAILNPSPANTLPPDIRKNITERHASTCRVLHSSVSGAGASLRPPAALASHQYFDELFEHGQHALGSKDYITAIRCLSQCIKLATSEDERDKKFPYLKQNFKVYCLRAEAYFCLGKYTEAIEDSRAARDLNPKCTQAYYRQGQAQFLIGQHTDCFAIISYGLSLKPTSEFLFETLVDAALKSDQFQADFEPKYKILKEAKMHTRPSVVVSVLGQVLLSRGFLEYAVIILESVLRMEGKCGDKTVISSAFSTLSYAYFLMKQNEKAINYMKDELEVENQLANVEGQCRVLNNMGNTYYKMRNYDESIEAHRKHNNLAMKSRLYHQLSTGLNAIGHVHVARNDFICALTSHSRCLEILKQLGDNEFAQFKELLSIGHIHTMLNDTDAAEKLYNEALQLLNRCKVSKEDQHEGFVLLYFNLAYLSLKKKLFSDAKQYFDSVMNLSKSIPTPKRYRFEMRAFKGLGQAHKLFNNFDEAQACFKKQQELAEMLKAM